MQPSLYLVWDGISFLTLTLISVPLYVLNVMSVSLSLSGASSGPSLCTSMATAQPQSATCGLVSAKGSRAGCTRRRLHSQIAHSVQYGHGSCWVRKTSRRTERGDRGREGTGGENNVGDMKICEQAREQSRTCEKCSSVLFCNALLWRLVWNWDVIRC